MRRKALSPKERKILLDRNSRLREEQNQICEAVKALSKKEFMYLRGDPQRRRKWLQDKGFPVRDGYVGFVQQTIGREFIHDGE